MEGAWQGAAGPLEHDRLDATRPEDEERIVLVRPDVVEHVEHVFGNLFQRLYHLADQTRERDGATAALLSGGIKQLEEFLQLVMDYFSPLPVALEFVPAMDIAQSLAREISEAVGCAVEIEAHHLGGRLLADPGRLVRAFALLAAQLGQDGDKQGRLYLHSAVRPPSRSLVLSLRVPAHLLATRATAAEMQWRVAEKVLESHGGALTQSSAAGGEISWEIVLPLQS